MAERQRTGTSQAVHEQLPLSIAHIDSVGFLQRQGDAPRIGARIGFTGDLALQVRIGVKFAWALLAKMLEGKGGARRVQALDRFHNDLSLGGNRKYDGLSSRPDR